MKKSIIYRLIAVISVASFFLFIGGFILGIQNVLSSKPSKLPSLPTDSIRQNELENILGLGDSLTRGIGDTEGKGYIGRLVQALNKENPDIQLTNLAISGYTSTNLLEQLSNKGVQRAISQSNLIVISVGGNDLFRGAEDLREINLKNIEATQELFLSNLKKITAAIRYLNKEAPIYLLGLYNPFEDLDQSLITSRVVLQWNYQTQLFTLSQKNMTFVPVADIFQGRLKEVLYTDHFHPNQEGYNRISNRLTQLINPTPSF